MPTARLLRRRVPIEAEIVTTARQRARVEKQRDDHEKKLAPATGIILAAVLGAAIWALIFHLLGFY